MHSWDLGGWSAPKTDTPPWKTAHNCTFFPNIYLLCSIQNCVKTLCGWRALLCEYLSLKTSILKNSLKFSEKTTRLQHCVWEAAKKAAFSQLPLIAWCINCLVQLWLALSLCDSVLLCLCLQTSLCDAHLCPVQHAQRRCDTPSWTP